MARLPRTGDPPTAQRFRPDRPNYTRMALRLIDPDPAPQPGRPPAELLLGKAQSALAAKDLAGYRALFAEAAAVTDVHRRYQARKVLVEAGLATRGGDAATVAPVFLIAARGAVEALEDEPREPVLLNYAGVALYEIGELPAAEALFAAAGRLDPALPNIERNIDEVRRRRRENVKLRLPAPVAAALRDVAPRARRVAAAAQPATGLKLSLCMIVKDEEAMLPRCLAAVRDHVDEIVIVDTGSSDRTVEIAEAFGANVLHHTWTGDFSAARNVSFDAATGDWLLYLDADEVLVDGDGERLRALTGRTWREAMYLVETNHTGTLEDGTAVNHNALRLFRNRPEYRFEGRIHEQIAQHLPGYLSERIEVTDVRVEHFGYLGVVRDAKEKSHRNIELLRRQQAEGDDSPFLHFNLGSEHGAAGEPQQALDEFRLAWSKVRTDPSIRRLGFAPSLANRLVKALRINGVLDEASARCAEILEIFPRFTDIVYEQAQIARLRGDADTAIRLLEQCLELGDAPSRYSPVVGSGTYAPLLTLADLQRRRGRLDEAEALVRRCLAEYGDYLGVVEPYATIRLAAGAAAADVVAELASAIDLTPGARFMLAVALHEAGAAVDAEAQLRLVLDTHPNNDAPVRLALAEALLSQGRLDEAATAVEPIGADSPWAAPAARTLAFTALAAADAGAATPAISRAEGAGLPTAELAAFAAWRDAVAGDEPPAVLPAAAAEPVLVMLEALARVEAYDAFETLAARFETVALDWRERREQLAQLYLRRGYLDSAADEWIAACEGGAGPDVRALVGLAHVAYAKDMREDALVFAQEAYALHPGDTRAAQLVERLGATA